MPARKWWLAVPLLLVLAGCAASEKGEPEEFPPVELGMERTEAKRALERAGGEVREDGDRVLEVVNRDRRVAEEVFLFYHDRLAAYTQRYAEDATRKGFQRLTRRFNLAYGEPIEQTDDGLVLRAVWKLPEPGNRLLLSGYVGGRGESAPLMVRVEDGSVIDRLIRDIRRHSLDGGDAPDRDGNSGARPDAGADPPDTATTLPEASSRRSRTAGGRAALSRTTLSRTTPSRR